MDIDESDDDEITSGFGGVSSDDDDHVEPRVRNISIRTGVLDEKAAATQAIGLFALHTKNSFAPYPFSLVNFISLSTYAKVMLYKSIFGFFDSSNFSAIWRIHLRLWLSMLVTFMKTFAFRLLQL